MRIKKLYLQNFLSYSTQLVELESGLNIVYGQNASGKTNLLDSVFYSSLGRSMRNLKDKELINRDNKTSGARVKTLLEREGYDHTVDVYIDPFGKKRAMLDGVPVSKIGQLIGSIYVVLFSPAEMKLVKDSPQDRRRFFDISLSQQSRSYFYALQKYNKLLGQRNKLLKEYKYNENLDGLVALTNEAMLAPFAFIYQMRKEFVEKLAPIVAERHSFLTDGKEALEIAYEGENLDEGDIKKSINELYEKSYEKDKKLEYTTVGIHRDDMKISVDGIDIRKYGSQGQQRTAVLSLKLAETVRFKDTVGEYPILLLDDVLSELDESRQKALLKAIDGIQTVVTCTEYDENIQNKFTAYLVKDKKVTKMED